MVQLKGTQIDSPQFTAHVHAGNLAIIYGFYNNSFNVRHHAGKPAGEPAMTRIVKVDEIISLNIQVFCLPSSQYTFFALNNIRASCSLVCNMAFMTRMLHI